MMWKTILFSLLLTITGSYTSPIDEEIPAARIVGGETTLIQKFPYQVELLHFKVHRCGASLISPTIVITAAHCLEKIKYTKSLSVRAGSSYRAKGGVVITVKRFLRHPKYTDDGSDYDLAILWLEEPFEYSEKIQPIALPDSNESVPDGAIGYASGWGKLYEGGITPEILHFVAVPIWNQQDCKEVYKNELTDNMICAGVKEGGKDACQQDSGGPLAVENKLVGVISWAVGCGRPNHPGVYARVAAMRDWIDEAIAEYSE